MESELHDGPSEFVKSLVKNLKIEEFEDEDKVFSNDMTDACKTICKICQVELALTCMRGHTKSAHSMTVKEYKEQFGNYRDQIVRKVYHKCGVCTDEMLLDADTIHLHVRRHEITLKEYNAKFVKRARNIGAVHKIFDFRACDRPRSIYWD